MHQVHDIKRVYILVFTLLVSLFWKYVFIQKEGIHASFFSSLENKLGSALLRIFCDTTIWVRLGIAMSQVYLWYFRIIY
jgi:hypothetical protein